MKYKIQYGKGKLALSVPRQRVVGIIRPKDVLAVGDVEVVVKQAIETPCKSRPLSKILSGKHTALIITVDQTRPSPAKLIVPILELCGRYGVEPTVMVALGRHRAMSNDELASHFGAVIMNRCRILQHNPFDESQMISKGITRLGTSIMVNKAIFEHDVVIGTGIIEPSYLAGYSGGRKLMMPGLAHHASIDNNHFYLTDANTKIGKLRGNPVSDDAAEFASRLPMHFIVYAVSGPNDEVAHIVAGHAVKAHALACKLSEDIYRVNKREADIVISSVGGAPYDCDLVQGKKAIIPATVAVRRNGVVIICAECQDGIGAEKTFMKWLLEKTPFEVTSDVRDRKQFSLGAHGANILARPIVQKNAKVILVTNPAVVKQLRGSYITAVTEINDALKLADFIVGKDSGILFIEKARRLILSDD